MFCGKRIALICALLMLFSLCACSGKNEHIAETTSVSETTASSDDAVAETELTENSVTQPLAELTSAEESSQIHENTTSFQSDELTKAEIVEFYKTAAVKSDSQVKSKQDIYLKSITINNGQFEKVMDFVTPIMAKLLANNSKETDGITGGYTNMTEADVQSAKVYQAGENTAIELFMKTQVGGARDDMYAGPVGHAVATVGDIGVVTDQLKDLGLPMEISDENTSVHYTNPAVRVIIDKNGNIIRGTWSYTVDIRLNNYKVFGKPVNSTSVIMENVITVNGGFSK